MSKNDKSIDVNDLQSLNMYEISVADVVTKDDISIDVNDSH